MGYRDRHRRPARRRPFRIPRPRRLVLCEGLTEKEYFDGIKSLQRDPLIEVIVEGQLGVPLTLVRIAKDRKRQAEKEARTEKDDNLKYDAVWCIFDVDDHPNLPDAKVMARDNGIELAISNPSFELWLLLHFRDSPGMQPRDGMRRLLKGFITDYNKHIALSDLATDDRDFEALHSDAVRRARRLDRDATRDNDEHRNPTTGVYRLTESILQVPKEPPAD